MSVTPRGCDVTWDVLSAESWVMMFTEPLDLADAQQSCHDVSATLFTPRTENEAVVRDNMTTQANLTGGLWALPEVTPTFEFCWRENDEIDLPGLANATVLQHDHKCMFEDRSNVTMQYGFICQKPRVVPSW